MKYTTIFFDLDDTIYPADSGLWNAIRQRISTYMHERLGIPRGQVPLLRKQFFEQYGTALRGIEANYPIQRSDYLSYVHDIPLTDYIGPDPRLRAALEALPARKFIFTNADAAHAARVMQVVDVADCFDGVIDINAIEPYCKPMPESFAQALKLSGEPDPHHCVLIDDLPRTTRAARALGMFAILFGAEAPPSNTDADAALKDWSRLNALLNGRS
jgi:putative hydrolase of the HAD superfamily